MILQRYFALVMESVEVVHEHPGRNLILYRLTARVIICLLHCERFAIAKQ